MNWVHDWNIPVPSWHANLDQWDWTWGEEQYTKVWLLPHGHASSGVPATCWRKARISNSNPSNTWCVHFKRNHQWWEIWLCQCLLPSSCPMLVWIHTQFWWCQHSPFSSCARHHYWCWGQTCISITVQSWSYEVFAEVKVLLRANDSIYLAPTMPEVMVKLAFTTITQGNCIAYIEHAGYI